MVGFESLTAISAVDKIGAWRSLVARLLWEQEAGGSNPSAPTNVFNDLRVSMAASLLKFVVLGGFGQLQNQLHRLRRRASWSQ